MRSVVGAAYDAFGYSHPYFEDPHDGMQFSTPDMDYDKCGFCNCASLSLYGDGLWYSKCGTFAVTIMPDAAWYNLSDWPFMKTIHIMVKLQ